MPASSAVTPGGRVVKKIPLDQRRRPLRFPVEQAWWKHQLWRLRNDSQYQRMTVQLAFLLLCLWIGLEFHLFMRWGLSGGTESFARRPPGVEGFLPISALISLSYWLHTGIINNIHPSGLFIFVAILGVSIALKKGFCSWICPVGTLSESLWNLGRKLFRRNLTVPRWLDYPLRSIKYLLLAFFVWSIGEMGVDSLATFIYSPYNRMADVKMYLFFAEIGGLALTTIILLILLSVVIKNFWCRYLCPYGALLGIVGWLSPWKITRNPSSCIDCALCTRACPSDITVHTVKRVWSDECMSCMACVEACPVRNTLDLRLLQNSRPVPTWAMGVLVVGVFVAVTGLALLTGHWQNGIARDEYQRRFQQLDSPQYNHFRGKVAPYSDAD